MRRTATSMRPARTLPLFFAFMVLISVSTLSAKTEASPIPSASPEESTKLHAALQALVAQIREFDQGIAETQEAIRTTPSDDLRSQRVGELRSLQRKRAEARLDLLDIISDADLSGFEQVEQKPFTLQGSIEDLIKPLIDEIRQATAGSRERRDLQDRFDATTQKTELLQKAMESLNHALKTVKDPDVISMLKSVRQEFQQRSKDSQNELTVLGFRLDEIENQSRSLVDETTGILASFFRERGRNLFLAILAAVVTGVGFRLLNVYLHRNTSLFSHGRNQATRLLDVALYTLTFVGAFVVIIIVFLIVGDWVLLGLMALLALALIFAAKDALPGYMDEIRLMLNLGSVREDERLVYNGVPWVVENLTFFTILRNPVLRGGMLRMPIAQLVGKLSRPATENEPYFPSEEGDWVLLSDETYGKIVFQSVEMVRIQLLGGATKMYPTSEYLEEDPQNHSQGFRVSSILGIDYRHQADVTGSILVKLNKFFQEAVEAEVDPSDIRSLKVEFSYANASSLDFVIQLDLDGSLAPKYNPISRMLQRIGVNACNHFGWEIPFQQVTVHRPSED